MCLVNEILKDDRETRGIALFLQDLQKSFIDNVSFYKIVPISSTFLLRFIQIRQDQFLWEFRKEIWSSFLNVWQKS